MIRCYPTADGYHAPASSLTAADVRAISPCQRQTFDLEMSLRSLVRGFVRVQWGAVKARWVWGRA